jgi:hypothetical protein
MARGGIGEEGRQEHDIACFLYSVVCTLSTRRTKLFATVVVDWFEGALSVQPRRSKQRSRVAIADVQMSDGRV